MEATPLSAADVGAVVNGNRNMGYGYGDGFGCGGGYWIWIILLFAIFGWGNGYGRNGNGITQLELQEGFNNQSVLRKLDGINSGLCDGFYAQNTTMLQGFNGIGREVLENRFVNKECCCETNRNIDAVRYEAAKNTCEITTNATANTQKILDKLCGMELAAKDQRIFDLSQTLQAAQNQLSQQAQTEKIVNFVNPRPIPAYFPNYYQSGVLGLGALNGFGCGCNNFA